MARLEDPTISAISQALVNFLVAISKKDPDEVKSTAISLRSLNDLEETGIVLQNMAACTSQEGMCLHQVVCHVKDHNCWLKLFQVLLFC